ncbi:MAG: thiamine phosphate synthase [Polyangiaceae bacterium]
MQLRDPQLSSRDLHRLGDRLRRVTADLGAVFLVNDRVDLALSLGADGVHLGRRSMPVADARALLGPTAVLSCSAHSVADVIAAAEQGASLALLSPIFASPGKGKPLGVHALTSARAGLDAAGPPFSLIALGGVTPDNAPLCLAAGASGLASIRADLLSFAADRPPPTAADRPPPTAADQPPPTAGDQPRRD